MPQENNLTAKTTLITGDFIRIVYQKVETSKLSAIISIANFVTWIADAIVTELIPNLLTPLMTDLVPALEQETLARRVVILKIMSDASDATALTTGDGKLMFFIPPELNGMNLVDADAGVSTVSSSGAVTVQIANVTDSHDMLSTAITIDQSEKTSYTAATPPVINTTYDDVATGDEIRVDVDGAGTGVKGLTVTLVFQLPAA